MVYDSPMRQDPSTVHSRLFGREPSETQKRLYDAYMEENRRGFSGRELDSEKFMSTLVIALTQTRDQGEFVKVPLIVPEKHKAWILGHIKSAAKVASRNHKDNDAGILVIRNTFTSIFLDQKSLQEKTGPKHWAAFGFSTKDASPGWLKAGLL